MIDHKLGVMPGDDMKAIDTNLRAALILT